MSKFVKSEYTQKYNKDTYKCISFRFNKQSEPDLIAWLDNQDSVTDYIRKLIRSDMKTSQRRHAWHRRTKASYEHNDVKHYPYEVIECLPYHDHNTLGYVRSMDEAADLIIKYCEQGCPLGEIIIVQRFIAESGDHVRGEVAGKQYHGC